MFILCERQSDADTSQVVRAEEARALAESMTDPEAKQLMLNVAADYERLAKRAEDRAGGNAAS